MFIPGTNQRLIRVGMFIDGGYFDEVSKYYKFQHSRQSRISVKGLQNFICYQSAIKEGLEPTAAQIVEAHYFRGRFSADSALQAGKLEDERRFDEVLMRAGVVQHYLPLDESKPRPQEKGIDVWLSLEAFDLAVHKGFDVFALIACDGDYVPLVRKLHGLGTRVMLLAWDFAYTFDRQGQAMTKQTRTNSLLIDSVSYPIMMGGIIDDRSRTSDPVVEGLFVNS